MSWQKEKRWRRFCGNESSRHICHQRVPWPPSLCLDFIIAAMRLPRFHSLGDDDGHFYALTYVPGVYVPPSGKSKDDAFFVLQFSPSAGFTRFSCSTVSPDGRLFHYSRGADHVDSAEYAILRAWREERVPLHA